MVEYDGAGAGALLGATEYGAGAKPERSKRSPMVELVAGGALTLVAGVADVKSPKSPKPLDMRVVCDFGGGGGPLFSIGAGLLSKKLPPEAKLGDVIEG